MGAGGIVSTLQDWAIWDAALDGERVLSRRAMAQVFAPAAAIPNVKGVMYGFGIGMGEIAGVRRQGHSGSTQGFSARYSRYPDRHVAVLVLGNAHPANLNPIEAVVVRHALPELKATAP